MKSFGTLMMLPAQNNSFNVSVYSDYSEETKDLSQIALNLTISSNQTVKLSEGEGLHDLMVQLHETFESFGLKSNVTNFSFGINPSWNKTDEYSIHYSISIKESLAEMMQDVEKLYDNLKFGELASPSPEEVQIQPAILPYEYYGEILS